MWVKREKFEQLKEHVEELVRSLKAAEQRTVLIDITTEGRKLKFIFVRNNEVFEIETMRLMSDNIKQWKDDLLK